MTNHNDDEWTDVSSNETVTDSCGCVMCDLGVCDDTLTIWCDMTPEEKGSLLLAKHEGKEIEFWANSFDGWVNHYPTWSDHKAYRIKPEEPKKPREVYISRGKYSTAWHEALPSYPGAVLFREVLK